MEVPQELVIAALQRRIADDAGTIAILQAALDQTERKLAELEELTVQPKAATP